MSGTKQKQVLPSEIEQENRTELVTRPQLSTFLPNLNQCLLIGLDSLDLGVYADWGESWPKRFENFERLKQKATDNQSKETPIISTGDTFFLVLGSGKAPMYRFHFQACDFHLWIGKSQKPNNNTPNLYVSLNSQSIWRYGLKEVIERMNKQISSLGADIERIQISRGDLCADFYVPEGFSQEVLIEQTVCNSGERRTYYNSNRLSSYYAGGTTADIKMRLYNKSLEITQHPDRAFFKEFWNVSEQAEVWRLEFQIARSFFKEFSIDTTEDLKERMQKLWHTLTHEWLTIRTGTDQNKSRREISEFWQAVQKAGNSLVGDGELMRREKGDTYPQAEWYISRIKNYVITLAALWQVTQPSKTLRWISQLIKSDWKGKSFKRAVLMKAIEKGWPVPEEGVTDEPTNN